MDGLSFILDALFPPRDTALRVRATTTDSLANSLTPRICGDGHITALFPYRDPTVHALIVETKYYGNTKAATLLGTMLREYLLEYLAEVTAVEKRKIVLVPLPLSMKRRRERGYNQIENILQVTASLLGDVATTDSTVLTRPVHTNPQTRLGKKAREENVRDAFAAHTPNPDYLYIVVDDVYTTGATMTEALRTLRDAGAKEALGIALAY